MVSRSDGVGRREFLTGMAILGAGLLREQS
jgi:hypothetical protein